MSSFSLEQFKEVEETILNKFILFIITIISQANKNFNIENIWKGPRLNYDFSTVGKNNRIAPTKKDTSISISEIKNLLEFSRDPVECKSSSSSTHPEESKTTQKISSSLNYLSDSDDDDDNKNHKTHKHENQTQEKKGKALTSIFESDSDSDDYDDQIQSKTNKKPKIVVSTIGGRHCAIDPQEPKIDFNKPLGKNTTKPTTTSSSSAFPYTEASENSYRISKSKNGRIRPVEGELLDKIQVNPEEMLRKKSQGKSPFPTTSFLDENIHQRKRGREILERMLNDPNEKNIEQKYKIWKKIYGDPDEQNPELRRRKTLTQDIQERVMVKGQTPREALIELCMSSYITAEILVPIRHVYMEIMKISSMDTLIIPDLILQDDYVSHHYALAVARYIRCMDRNRLDSSSTVNHEISEYQREITNFKFLEMDFTGKLYLSNCSTPIAREARNSRNREFNNGTYSEDPMINHFLNPGQSLLSNLIQF